MCWRGSRNKLFLLFESKSGGYVFTPAGLRDICVAEALFIENRQFAAGGMSPKDEHHDHTHPYPGTCLVRPRPNSSVPLAGTFGSDCTAGPISLITDLFYPAPGRPSRTHTCTHASTPPSRLKWDKHMAKDGQISERHLDFDCLPGGTNQCVLLDLNWVDWRHNKLLCDATTPGSDFATVNLRAANS
jgi:hypothetical protein